MTENKTPSTADLIMKQTIAKNVQDYKKTVYIRGESGELDVPVVIKSPTVALRREMLDKSVDNKGMFDALKYEVVALCYLCSNPETNERLFNDDHIKLILEEHDHNEEWFQILAQAAMEMINPKKDDEERKKK